MRTTGTHNSVDMATCPAGSDDRVDARVEDGLSTGQAPKRICRRDKEEPHDKNREDHHKPDRKRTKKESCERNEPVDAGIPGFT